MRHIFHASSFYLMLLLGTGLAMSTSSVATANTRSTDIAEKILANINKTNWIQEGGSTHIVYIFFDPNCPYCHRLFVNTRDTVKQKAITFRWIPVGVLTATSFGKALAILGAKNPVKAFYRNEEHYARKSGGGGIDEGLASDKAEKNLKTNGNILELSHSSTVPLMLFRATNGQAIMIQGSPPKKRLKQILHYVK